MRRILVLSSLPLFVAGCAGAPREEGAGGGDTAGGPPASPPAAGAESAEQSAERARIDSLMQVARDLARTEGCPTAERCASIPLGARACGGPHEYVVYCPLTTDTAALRATAEEIERAERAYNEKWGVVSTCEMRLEPELVLEGGACRGRPAGGPTPK